MLIRTLLEEAAQEQVVTTVYIASKMDKNATVVPRDPDVSRPVKSA
jgi:hypothetical protein